MLEKFIDFFQKSNEIRFFGLILVCVLVAWIAHVIFIFIFRKTIKEVFPDLYGKITSRLYRSTLFLFLITGCFFPFYMVRAEAVWMQALRKGLVILLIIAISWVLIRVIRLLRLFILERYDITLEDNLQARKVYTQYRILERIGIFVVLFVGLGVALMTFDSIRQIGLSLLTSAGISALIIGLAAQRIIGAFLAGIQLAVTQPIRIDDVVIVEGEWGRIEEINLTYVVVRIWDLRRLVLPTTYFIEKPFQNWTMTSADILGTVYIYTDYRIPVDTIREALTKFLKEADKWDGKVNVLQVTNTTDRSVELRALMSAPNASDAWDLRVFIREKLIDFLQNQYPEYLPRTRIEIEDKPFEKKKEDKNN